jgi:hypothetical protein
MVRRRIAKAEKRVRVTDDTFAKWRQQREDLGFKFDEDFAKYLLRVGQSLQKLNMLEHGEGESHPEEVESELRYANQFVSAWPSLL